VIFLIKMLNIPTVLYLTIKVKCTYLKLYSKILNKNNVIFYGRFIMKIRIGLVFNLCVIPRYTYTVMDCYAVEVMGLVFILFQDFVI